MIDRLLRTSGVWEGEPRHRTRDGGLVYVATQWVVYRDAYGITIRILEVNADITARRHAEELLTRSQKLEALSTLAESLGIQETIQKPATADKLAGALDKILSAQPTRMQSARR